MLRSSLMRCHWGALLWKFTSAVSVCRSSCPMAEQSAAGLTDLLASGGQHFSIFNALILNFPVPARRFSGSDHVHTAADNI